MDEAWNGIAYYLLPCANGPLEPPSRRQFA
jgi:hypothetical protein